MFPDGFRSLGLGKVVGVTTDSLKGRDAQLEKAVEVLQAELKQRK